MTIRALHEPLALSPLAARALDGEGRDGWYPARPAGHDWEKRAGAARASVGEGWLDELRPALRPDGVALARIERAAAAGIVVTTGQQPGLFGGPLYTWFKAITVLALADELEARLSIPVAPVFWAATDDSDLVEATVTVVAAPGGWERIALDVTAPRDTPMSAVAVGDVRVALDRLSEACGSGSNSEILRAVRSAYVPASTLGGAYVTFLRDVLHPLGVSVLDASHPAARSAGSALLRRALERADDVAERLQERTSRIVAAGLRPQVQLVPGRTLVFRVNAERRRRIHMAEAADAAAAAGPEELSPNVLLRPLVERAILPTVAYVGGPAEIAYFAQVSAVAGALGVDAPLILPRWSGFLIEPHVQDALDELGVTIADLRDPHRVETQIARAEVPESIRRVLANTRDNVAELSAAVIRAAMDDNLPISAGAVEGAGRQLTHKLDRFERRLVAAAKRRGSDALHQLRTARGSLFPDEMPQERALNVIPFLARYGPVTLERVLEAARSQVRTL